MRRKWQALIELCPLVGCPRLNDLPPPDGLEPCSAPTATRPRKNPKAMSRRAVSGAPRTSLSKRFSAFRSAIMSLCPNAMPTCQGHCTWWARSSTCAMPPRAKSSWTACTRACWIACSRSLRSLNPARGNGGRSANSQLLWGTGSSGSKRGYTCSRRSTSSRGSVHAAFANSRCFDILFLRVSQMLRRSAGDKTRESSNWRRSTMASYSALGTSASASMRSCHRPPSVLWFNENGHLDKGEKIARGGVQ